MRPSNPSFNRVGSAPRARTLNRAEIIELEHSHAQRARRARTVGHAVKQSPDIPLALVFASLLLVVWPITVIAQTEKGPPRVRHVYIPQEDLEAIFGEGKKGALLTRDEFNELWQKAHGEDVEVPPADAVPTRARYEAELAEHELRITAHLQLVKLQAAWQTVELQFGGVAIESAKIDGQPARLGRNPDGCLIWILHDKGRYELSLEISAPVVRTGGDLTAWLQLPPLPSSQFLLQLPEEKQVRVRGVEVKSAAGVEGKKTVRIPIDQSGHVPLAILDSTGVSHRVPLVFANTNMTGTVEPSGVRWQADVTLDVAAQPAEQFHLTLPRNVEVASVEASDLAGWKITDNASDRLQLTISFRQPLQGQRRVHILGLAPIKLDEAWAIPALAVSDAVSNVGEVTLQPADTLRLEISEMNGIRRLPVPDSKPHAATAATPLRFAFWNEHFTLRLRATPRERELSVALASLVDVARTGLTLRTSLTVEPRYASLFDLALELPGEWTIVSLQAGGAAVAWEATDARIERTRAGDDPRVGVVQPKPPTQFIRFDLPQPVAPGNTITIALTAELHPQKWLEPEGEFSSVTIPEVRLVGASEVEGTLIVESPREVELRTSELSPDLEPIPPPPGPTTPEVGTALAYHHQDDAAVAGRVEARLKPAQISVETLAFASLGRESLTVHYQADIQITGGQVRSIDFTLPADVGEKIQVTPVNQALRVIEQQHTVLSAEAQGADEQFLWHVVFDRPVTGQLLLTISFEQQRVNGATREEKQKTAEDKTGNGRTGDDAGPQRVAFDSPLFAVLQFRNVARQTGYIAIEAANDQEVEEQAENLREVDPADLPLSAVYQPGRIVAAYQYQRLPFQLRLSGERRESKEVLAAACDHAMITSVLSREGIMRHQVHYQLRSLGVQHLAVQLPAAASLWSGTLDGVPIEVRRTSGKYIIPLPAGGPNRAAGQHVVELIYETTLATNAAQDISKNATEQSEENKPTVSRPSAQAGLTHNDSPKLNRLFPQTIRQAAPVVNMTVLQLTWNVVLPNGTVVVSSDGDFKPTVQPTRPSLIAGLSDAIAENCGENLGIKLIALAVALACGVVVWMLAQSRGILAALLVFGIVCVIVAMLVPSVQQARESARHTQVRNNLRQLGLATGNYKEHADSGAHGMFPSSVDEDEFPADIEAMGRMERGPGQSRLRGRAPDRPGVTSESQAGRWADPGAIPAAPAAPLATGGEIAAPREATGFAAPNGERLPRLSFDVADDDGVGPPAAAAGVNAPTAPPLAAANPVQSLYSQLGRLSLSMNLETHGRPGVQFTREGGVGELVLRVQDDSLARTLQWVVTVIVGMVAWLMRRQSRAARAGMAALCILVPIGLSGILPLAWTLVLDGLFVGGLVAIGIWLANAVAQVGLGKYLNWTARIPNAATRSATTTALLLFALVASADAQTNQATPKAKTDTPKTKAVTPATAPADAPQEDIPGYRPKSTLIDSKPFTLYVPYDPKNGDPRDSRWVYVPYEQFQRLWTLANPDKPIEPAPGVPATVAEVGYEGRLDGDVARFDGRFVVYTYQDKWTRVGLPLGNVALEKIELDGQAATVEEKTDEKTGTAERKPDNQAAASAMERLAIYVEKAGMHVVDLQFSVPVTRLGATGRMAIPLRPAASGRLRFELPAPDLDVQIEGITGGWRIEKTESPASLLRLNPERRTLNPSGIERETPSTTDEELGNGHANGQDENVRNGRERSARSESPDQDPIKTHKSQIKNTHLSLPVGGAAEITIRWQPRRGDAPATQLTSVDQTVLVDIQDSGVHLRGQVHYRIAQGSLRKLELRVPPGLAVRSVTGSDVADWSLADDQKNGDEQRLEIALKTDLRTGTDIEIDAFMLGQQSIGAVNIRTLEPLGVARETGRIVIGCSGQFHVRIAGTSNVAQIERDGVQVPGGGDAACELLSAYRYTARPWTLELMIERLRPRVLVAGHTAVGITRDRATMHAALETTVSDSPLGSLRLRLPPGLRVNRVTVPPGCDWFVDRNAQETHLLVELAQPMTGKIPIELIGTLSLDPRDSLLRVPMVAVMDAAVETGQLAIVLDQDTDAHQENAAGARAIAPSEFTGSLQPLAAAPRVFAFQYNRLPDGLSLRLNAAGSQLTADALTTVSVREGSVAYLSEINFDIRGAARSQLQFTTPDWLGNDIDVQSSGVRQIRSAAEPAGRRTWTITLQQPVRGKYPIRLLQSLPLPSDGMISAAFVEPLQAESLRSYVILENRAATQLTERAAQGVSSLQPSEVPLTLNDELRRRAISAHKVLNDQAKLVWLRQEREQEKAIAANVNLADLVTVIHRDGTYRTQAAYVVTNRTRQFLEIALPPKSQLWAVYVGGQPVRPASTKRGNREVTLVPLQKISAGEISTQVVVVYAGSLGGKIGRWAHVAPQAPDVLGDLPVARTLWTIYTPDEFSSTLVERDSNMTPVAAGDLVVARDLAFFEELNELIKVCKFSSSRNANRLACDNLKQISGALPAFQRPATSETPAVHDNRQWWRMANPTVISEQLQTFYCPSNRTDGLIQLGEVKGKEDWTIVQQRARELQTEIGTIVMNQPDVDGDRSDVPLDQYFSESRTREVDKESALMGLADVEQGRAVDALSAKPVAKAGEERDEKETRRSKLREQNWANVGKLKEEQGQTRALQGVDQSPGVDQSWGLRYSESNTPFRSGGVSTFEPKGSIQKSGGRNKIGSQTSDNTTVGGGQLADSDVAARAGIQSIAIEIPLVGKPQHFMRLLGDPKLTLTARHHDLTRWSASIAWALLCFALAALFVVAFAHVQAWVWLQRHWPWLAVALGAAWLFLLPLGVGGFALVLLGISVLAWRTRYLHATTAKAVV